MNIYKSRVSCAYNTSKASLVTPDLEISFKGHSRSLKQVPFKSLGPVSCLLSIVTNYGAILYRLRDIATYWSKIAKFLYPHLIWRLHSGWPRRNFGKVFDTHKTRMIGLRCGEETLTTCYTVSIPERKGQKDRLTNGRTEQITISISRVMCWRAIKMTRSV